MRLLVVKLLVKIMIVPRPGKDSKLPM
jgi:hypothetical protein